MGKQNNEATATNAVSPSGSAADCAPREDQDSDSRHSRYARNGEGDMIEVRVPAQPRYTSVARQAIETVCGELDMTASDRAAVRLAVGEACNNAILHAPPVEEAHAAPPVVTVQCRVLRDALEIDVTNEGTAIFPGVGAKMPDPLSESGRGVALIETMMDSVQYLCQQGKTTVRMRKNRHDAAAVAMD